ncbi:MAG TPA: hypothetical protein VKB05_03365 [Pyrinomonadaceae bacterium]|nr:hypothetical protein [Pyrinomonadaceae bacterium]
MGTRTFGSRVLFLPRAPCDGSIAMDEDAGAGRKYGPKTTDHIRKTIGKMLVIILSQQ